LFSISFIQIPFQSNFYQRSFSLESCNVIFILKRWGRNLCDAVIGSYLGSDAAVELIVSSPVLFFQVLNVSHIFNGFVVILNLFLSGFSTFQCFNFS